MTVVQSPGGRSWQPSVVALLFGIWALIATFGYSGTLLSTDGDVARHLVLGKHILKVGPQFPDVFSYTKAGETFSAWEWLSDVLFSLIHQVFGLAGVAIAAGLLIAGAVALVALFLRPRVEAAVTLLIGNMVAVGTYPHWIARPHLFSFLALPILLLLVTKKASWGRHAQLALLFAIWANLHPGFVYGLGVLGAYLVGDSLDNPTWKRCKQNLLSASFAALGTVCNPFGLHLHRDILIHLRSPQILSMVEEFQPIPMFSTYGVLAFLCLSAIILALSAREQRLPLSVLFPFLAALFAALVAVRYVPLFGLFALPLVASGTADGFHHWHWKPIQRARKQIATDDQRARTAPLVLAVVGVLGILAVTSGRVGSFQVIQDQFSDQQLPVQAVVRAREAGLQDETIFSQYHWGGYILYAWPEQTIFIDGLADFFGYELLEEYLGLWETRGNWRENLQRRGINLLILPPGAPLAQTMRQASEWNVWYEDDTAVVLRLRTPSEEGGQ